MKIKNKLIAGGLMSVVACALVGSITGTFAWYQYSNQSTVSMHGASIGSSQNLQLAWSASEDDDDWSTANLTWSDIKSHAAFKGIDGTGENAVVDQLYPATNGANAGNEALNTTWYTNPTGGTTLPEVKKENNKYVDGYFVQFTFYARYQEYASDQASYPNSKIYIDEIASKVVSNRTKDITFALRMHVQMGASTYFVVNPYSTTGKTVTLSSTYSEVASQYDWTTPAGSPVTVSLPPKSGTGVGSLVSLDHAAVVQSFNADGSLDSTDTQSVYVETSTKTGVPITVTFWLEGFAQSNDSDANSDWWNAGTTIGDVLDFGFQLRGVKNPAA